MNDINPIDNYNLDLQNEPNNAANYPKNLSDANCCVPKDQVTITNFYKKSANPSVALIYVGIKLGALFVFIFFGLFASNEAVVMITVLIATAADFWFTKNIAGRILVGLRWWINFDYQRKLDIWTFESKNEIKEANADRVTFWTALYGFTGAWLVLFVWDLIRLKFSWMFCSGIALVLSGVNTYGYFRCSKSQQKGAEIVMQYVKAKMNKQNQAPMQ